MTSSPERCSRWPKPMHPQLRGYKRSSVWPLEWRMGDTNLGSQVVAPPSSILLHMTSSRPPNSLYIWITSASYPRSCPNTHKRVLVDADVVDGRAGGIREISHLTAWACKKHVNRPMKWFIALNSSFPMNGNGQSCFGPAGTINITGSRPGGASKVISAVVLPTHLILATWYPTIPICSLMELMDGLPSSPSPASVVCLLRIAQAWNGAWIKPGWRMRKRWASCAEDSCSGGGNLSTRLRSFVSAVCGKGSKDVLEITSNALHDSLPNWVERMRLQILSYNGTGAIKEELVSESNKPMGSTKQAWKRLWKGRSTGYLG